MKGKEGTFTQYPNEIQEALHTTYLSPNESRIFHFIMRKTYGFHQNSDQISQRQIANGTGLDRRTVRSNLQRLKKRKIFLNKPFVKGGRYTAPTLGINPNVNQWLRVGEISRPGGMGELDVLGGRDTSPYKRKNKLRQKKENAQDGDGSSSAHLGSQKNTSPLTEKQLIANAKYIQKKENRPGLAKAVEEKLKMGTDPRLMRICLDNRSIHGVDLVQTVKELPTANETTNS